MSDDALFKKELRAVGQAKALLDAPDRLADAQDRAAFEALFKDYQRLFRSAKRLIRLADNNERELARLAAEQRTAAEEVSRKNAELEVLSTRLSKYLSPQVFQSIFSGKQQVEVRTQRRKLTVFFSDIAGFTQATERLESEDLTQLINQYLTEMTNIALAHGATVDKYVGDAIMTFFGDPETRGTAEDARAAVRMAVDMQARMRELSAQWRAAGVETPLKARMGINTGFCTVGNFGSEDRMDYTLLGGAVNVASRLEGIAEPGSILISYETYALVRDEMACAEVGQTEIRGLSYPVTTYQVLGDRGVFDALADKMVASDPHFELSLDPRNMDRVQREAALMTLEEAIQRLK